MEQPTQFDYCTGAQPAGQPWKATSEAKCSILDQKPKTLHPNTTLVRSERAHTKLGLDQTSQINPFRLMKVAKNL